MSNTAPESIQFIITQKCFLNCKFCDEPQQGHLKETVIKSQYLKIIEKLKNWGINKLTITGGEPTTVNCLKDILQRAKKSGFKTSLATNGIKISLPNSKNVCLLDQLANTIDILKLSVHGIGGTYDEIVGLKGAFDGLVLTLEKSLNYKNKFETQVTFVVTKDNIKEIGEVFELCLKYKVDQLTLNEIYPRGRGKNFSGIIPNQEISKIKTRLLADTRYFKANNKLQLVVRPARPSCILVYPSADVFVSHYDLPEGLYLLGNLFKDDIVQKWNEFPFKEQFLTNYDEVNVF